MTETKGAKAVGRPFGEEYYADGAHRPGWHQRAQHFDARLRPLLDAIGVDAHDRVQQTLKFWRAAVHRKLRATTQLGKGDAAGMQVNIEVSGLVPPPVLERLEALPAPLLWVLLNRPLIRSTRLGLEALHAQYAAIADPQVFIPRNVSFTAEDMARGAEFVRQLDQSAVHRVDEEVNAILRLAMDTLGAYFFRAARIELYWVVLWIVASQLGVMVEDLTLVVLVHEMAHFYTHVGHDADGHDWRTDMFARADNCIVEGAAQFYTEQFCRQLVESSDARRPLEAFQRLVQHQSTPYTCFQNWLPVHEKRAEGIRRALVIARSRGITDYHAFLETMKDGAAQL
ncbi:MAG: hypothetical protein U0324_39715 [Polyangiales bacterium]